jgi:hypothetical protein
VQTWGRISHPSIELNPTRTQVIRTRLDLDLNTSNFNAQDYSRQRLRGTAVALRLLAYDKEKPRFSVEHRGFGGAELLIYNP